jgi:microcystin-dependent protein
MPVQPLWLQNIDYPARWDRSLFDNLWENEGVIGTTSFAVTQRAIPAMSVDVAAGVAVVQGDDQAFQGKYLCREEAVTSAVTITAAPGSGTRHDIVVLKVNDPNAGGAAGNNAVIQVVTGVASGSPVDPAIPASALPLARVRVASGTGTITNAMIDDLRLQSRVVGATSPVGSIVQFAGSTAPAGWLLCDGTAVSQALYPSLFTVIGGTYNQSGGQSIPSAGLFRVPLLTGRIPVGRDASQTEFDVLGETGGAKTHTLTSAEMPSHTHTQNAHTHTQDAHNHTQNAHNHTQDSHNHTQNSHNHTQDSHAHGTVGAGAHNHSLNTSALDSHDHFMPARQTSSTSHTHTGVNTVAAGFAGTDTFPFTSGPTTTISPSANAVGDHTHGVTGTTATNQGATATNIATTAVNQATTAVNQATTATNQSATATNQNTGGGTAHNNLQPYIVLNYIIKT